MSRFTLCVLDEMPEGGLHGPVKVGEVGGEILVDCPRKLGRCDLACRVYRKDGTKGGRHVHRAERAVGVRREALQEHRFLGEVGT